ncbi:hypothetical protein Bca52824_077426 [Brassica carinata]|uniref:Uncharacterized protein n=1 Tax=Brassica carinata TaxID=52824 RepID=A0A8X7PWS6_BRACI|nr:hypothetical protein Bca52824_077426 [Brassica carinata]
MVKPSDFKAVHRLIQFHYTRVVNPVTVSRSKLIASSSPAAFPSNGFTQFHPKSSFHTFSSIPTTKNVGFSQICGLASVKPRFKNVNFASAFRLFSTSGFRKVDGSFARKVVEKPMRAVSSSVGRYRVALGLHVDAFWKKNSPVVFGAGGVFVCIFLWRVMFGIASTFVGLSEGMAKYGFLALSSAIVAFAGLYLRARFTINPDKVYRIAMRKLNTAANILEVMGAPLTGSDLRAYVMSGGGITLKSLSQQLGASVAFCCSRYKVLRERVSLVLKSRRRKYGMKLLAVDIPMASGPDQRLFLIGDEEEYRVGGGLISELRDPVVKAMAAAKEFDNLDRIEDEEDEERELLEAERKQREETEKLEKDSS